MESLPAGKSSRLGTATHQSIMWALSRGERQEIQNVTLKGSASKTLEAPLCGSPGTACSIHTPVALRVKKKVHVGFQQHVFITTISKNMLKAVDKEP